MSSLLPTGNVPMDCHAKVRRLAHYWRTTGPGDRLPGRQHIDPVELGVLLGNIWLADVSRAPLRFRYRLAGTRIVKYIGVEPTGKWLDEVIPHFETTHTAHDLTIVADEGAPRWRRGAPSVRKDLYFKTLEQLSLPLAADGRTVDMILNLTLFLDEEGFDV